MNANRVQPSSVPLGKRDLPKVPLGKLVVTHKPISACRFSRPGGATENSPAIYRWGRREKAPASPAGTAETRLGRSRFDRPYGT